MNFIRNKTNYSNLLQEHTTTSTCYFISNDTSWVITNNILTSCLTLATIIIFFGNLLIILWIATRNRLKRICDLYIASLALADFLVSVFVLPFAIIRQNLGYWPFESTLLCQFHISSDIFLCMSSILNLCCISIDRYVAISYPLQYITKQSRRISIIMILIAWIIPSFSILPPLFGMSKHVTGVGCCYISYSKEYRIYSSVLAYFLPIILIGYVHLRIFYIIRRRSKVFNPFNIDSKKQESRTNLSRLIPLLTDHFSKRFIQRNKKLENDISLLHFNNIHNNDIDITDALSYTYHWTNDCIDSKDIYHRNKIDFYFDTSNELEINEPEPVDENLKTLYIFHIPITEHDVIDESYLDESLLNKHTSSSNGCFNGMVSKCQYLYKHRNRSSLRNKSVCERKTERTIKTQRQFCEKVIFNKEQKAVRTVTIVIGCFIVCWTPFFIFYLSEAICDCTFSEELYTIVTWLGYFNSIFNPFIYGFYNKEYANAFKHIVLLKGCR
ncbi:putative biogenic amine receptor [Schistosoma mansoni]|uniref:GPR-3 n=1 Tax=Schistosoma mansoni TaxID=6183 RepID=C4Q8W8_SCHMA|nr:putative biogenic amine receptor [Schistosoma mansoni]ACT36165.1 GPR-3 [Schistosoma mansoni]|eukprot:XP_018651990.1 putative biogenic amine receptor [Schistosoma mansoni]